MSKICETQKPKKTCALLFLQVSCFDETKTVFTRETQKKMVFLVFLIFGFEVSMFLVSRVNPALEICSII